MGQRLDLGFASSGHQLVKQLGQMSELPTVRWLVLRSELGWHRLPGAVAFPILVLG